MKAAMLAAVLKTFPEDAEVYMAWDGAARTVVDVAWLAQARQDPLDGGNEKVVLASEHDMIYDDEDRPVEAPNSVDVPYWRAGNVSEGEKVRVER